MSRLLTVLDMVKWRHTAFALPMAFAGAALAAEAAPAATVAEIAWRIALIVVAVALARASAMCHNRWADRALDATNPRTVERPSVTGAVSPQFMLGFTVVCAAGFIAIAAVISPLALALSPVFLAVLLGYSHAKRFTALAHVWLGVALGLAPVGAWVAMGGPFAWAPLLFGTAVAVWVAGFDILYALADIEHDRREGLHSVPARLGVVRALRISSLFHFAAAAGFLLLATQAALGWLYLLGLAVALGALWHQHAMVSPRDLSRLPRAFLHHNAVFSAAVMAGVLLDVGLG